MTYTKGFYLKFHSKFHLLDSGYNDFKTKIYLAPSKYVVGKFFAPLELSKICKISVKLIIQ